MVKFINKYVELNPCLTHEERNILSAGYKNVISNKRASWRLLNSMEKKEEKKNTSQLQYIKEVKSNIEKELSKICKEIQEVIDKYLIPNAKDSENKVFYLKLKGDYHRYMSEYSTGNEFDIAVNEAEKAYKEAYEIAEKEILRQLKIKGMPRTDRSSQLRKMGSDEEAIAEYKASLEEVPDEFQLQFLLDIL